MRLSPEQLSKITGKKRKSSQVQWFKDYLAIEVPADHQGPIITEAAYEDLVKKRLGLAPSHGLNNPQTDSRPRVKLTVAH